MSNKAIGNFHARASLDATDFDAGTQRMAESLNMAAREIDNAWGIIDNRAVKSAQASARVFEKSGLGPIMPQVREDYGAERIQQAIESNRSLTAEMGKVGNSARASAAVFVAAIEAEEEAMRAAAKTAQETANLRIQQAAESNRAITQQSSAVQKSARESAAVFDAAFEEIDRSNAEFTASYINRSAQRKASIFDEAAIMEGHASSSHRAAMGVNSLYVAQGKTSKTASKFGLVMQQSGYQIQDFAVQVAGGQNALVALSQQGSQFLSVFGGWGAVAGAALSVGVLAYRMYDLADSSGEAKESLGGVAAAIRRVNEAEEESKYNRMNLAQQGTQIRTDIKDSKAELTALRVAAAFTLDEKERVAILEKQEGVRLRIIELGDKELANKKAIAEQERDAYNARVALAEKMSKEIDAAIAASKAAYRARLNVTGSELEKLKVDMEEATWLVNQKDQGQQAQGWSMAATIKQEVDAIRNQLDPMRERRKEQERYSALVTQGLLSQGEVDRLNGLRNMKIIESLQSRIPQSLAMRGGGQSTGGFVGSQNTAQTTVKLLQDMLTTLNRIAVGVN